jgi:phage tail sheath gpL-like
MAIEVAAPVVEFLSFDRTTAGTKATGSVTLNSAGTDGDTVTISDSIHALTFELDSNGATTSPNIPVAIAASAELTSLNLLAAINASGLAIVATDGGTGIVTLTAAYKGTSGNETVTETGSSMTAAGMSSGANAVLAVGLNDTVGTPELTVQRMQDGAIKFTNVDGIVRYVHSDNPMVAELFDAIKAVVAA